MGKKESGLNQIIDFQINVRNLGGRTCCIRINDEPVITTDDVGSVVVNSANRPNQPINFRVYWIKEPENVLSISIDTTEYKQIRRQR